MPKPVVIDNIQHAVQAALSWLKAHIWFVLPGSIFLVFAIAYALLYLPINKVDFTFSDSQTCINHLTLFPASHQPTATDSDMHIEYHQVTSLANRQIWASQACLSLSQIPQPGNYTVKQSLLGLSLLSQSYQIEVSSPPSVNTEPLQKPVSVRKPLLLAMNQTDAVHQYFVAIEELQTPCQVADDVLHCHLHKLDLKQGHQYELALGRSYLDQATVLTETKIETLSATTVVDSSIKPDQKVFDQPQSLTIDTDKELLSAQAELVVDQIGQSDQVDQGNQDDTQIEVQTQVKDKQIVVTWDDKLPRVKKFTLTIHDLEAKDGSTLEDPFQLTFTTSDGPQVARISLPRVGVALNSQAVITFDQPIQSGFDLSQIIRLNNSAVALSHQQKQVTVSLQGVPRCADFEISVKGALVSDQQVESQVDWSYNARTICRTTEVIGHSVQGRAIVAYKFGSGPTHILYTGAIHGNEVGTKYLMDQWINELEAKARQLPAGRTIVVVPLLNPDGFAAGTRNNANNVDLNRNYDTSDWRKDITDTSGRPIPNGGGKEPMSEPETKAIANYTARLKPRTTMSFHNVGGLVIANQASHSSALAQIYAQMTGYRNATGQSSTTFNYVISGTYDDWIAEKHGLASVLIEMSSRTNPEFSRNVPALWRVAQY